MITFKRYEPNTSLIFYLPRTWTAVFVASFLSGSLVMAATGQNPSGDLDKFKKYCHQLRKVPHTLEPSDLDARKHFEPRPDFQNPELTFMVNKLIDVSVHLSKANEVGLICQLYPTIVKENDSNLQCRESIRIIRRKLVYSYNPEISIDDLKKEVLKHCSGLCGMSTAQFNKTLKEKGSKLEDSLKSLQSKYDVIPLSIFFAMRRQEGGNVRTNSDNNVMGVAPNGQTKTSYKSLPESVHKWVKMINCGKDYAPFHVLSENIRVSSSPKDQTCPPAAKGEDVLPGLTKYNPRGVAYLAEVRNLMDNTYHFTAMDQLWREHELEKCGLIQVQLKPPGLLDGVPQGSR